MSEISVLSHEYRTAAEFSQRINWALIHLKKNLLWPSAEAMSSAESAAYRLELATILEGLVLALDAGSEKPTVFQITNLMPGALLAQLRREKQGDLDYYLEDLERTARRLRNVSESLTEQDIQLLDELASLADAQASQVFNRLMRK